MDTLNPEIFLEQPASAPTKISGAVLTGGLSSRFGSDKAEYIFRGKSLLRWALDSFSNPDVTERVTLVGQDYFGMQAVHDVFANCDVMGGIHAASLWSPTRWFGVLGCDQPFFSPAYWAFLASQITERALCVVPVSDGLHEPLGALYNHRLEAELRRRLQRGDLRMQSLFGAVATVKIPTQLLTERFGKNLFVNANRIQDLEQI
jgi:molybdenum cofactor guanylyltransferase